MQCVEVGRNLQPRGIVDLWVTWCHTLCVLQAAVDLENALRREAGALELTVYVGGIDEEALLCSSPTAKYSKTVVGPGLSVEGETGSVEAPGERRYRAEKSIQRRRCSLSCG